MKTTVNVKNAFQPLCGFDIPGNIEVNGYAVRTPYTPTINSMFRFSKEVFRDLLNWWRSGTKQGMLLFGPTGCGKSESLYTFFGALNVPVYEKTIHSGMDFTDLIGNPMLENGKTVFRPGPLAMAMGYTGAPGVLMINEVGRADDGVLTGLYETFQGRPILVDGNTPLAVSPEFRFCATSNSGLMGDRTGRYRGEKVQDLAFVDRFRKVGVSYPDSETERSILSMVCPNLAAALINVMIEIANDIRSQFLGESESAEALEITCSTRTLVEWGKMVVENNGAQKDGVNPLIYALDRALLNGTNQSTKMAVHQIVYGYVGETANEQVRAVS